MKVLKVRINAGRFAGELAKVTNVSLDELGRQRAACVLADGTRANIPVADLTVLEDAPEPEIRKPKTASMPFISGSTGSRSLTHTRNMAAKKIEVRPPVSPKSSQFANCQDCGQRYDLEARRGQPGKLTQCEGCAAETESKVEGRMIFSHKTGATIEIKKDGELRHEAETFDPKNKT